MVRVVAADPVLRNTGASAFGFGLGPMGKLAGSRRELLWRTDRQLFYDPLTLRRDAVGVAAELAGNLFVCFPVGEAPQQLLVLRRQFVVFGR